MREFLTGLLASLQDPHFMQEEWLAIAQTLGFGWNDFGVAFGLFTIAVIGVCALVWGWRHGNVLSIGTAGFIFTMCLFLACLMFLKVRGPWTFSLTVTFGVLCAWLF